MSNGNNWRTKLYFRWDCPDVKATEFVCVVGSCEELGDWDVSRGVPLSPHASDASCWTSKAVAVPLGRSIEYKYFIRDRNSDALLRWEDREGNRHAKATGRKLIIEDDGGKHRQLVSSWAGEVAAGTERPTTGSVPSGGKGKDLAKELLRGESLQVSSSDSVVVVFRSLPVRLLKGNDGTWSVDKSAEAETFKVVSFLHHAFRQQEGDKHLNIKFAGDPGVRPSDKEEQQKITELLAKHDCIPVFVDQQTAEKHLEFCHMFLWPVMHNMKVFEDLQDRDETTKQIDMTFWKHYQTFNRLYAEAVEANTHQRSLVWVHDFYLLLMPRYLHLRRADSTIGFFLHSAFPSSEVLRCIPMREEILQSLLSCRVVTFQTFEHTRHFLSSCQLLLNTTHAFRAGGVMYVQHEGRSVVLRAGHFALPFSQFEQRMSSDEVIQRAKELREQLGDRVVFASIDGDEPFSGLILKLRAFHRFLKECPQHMDQVVLMQHVLARKVGDDSEILHEVKRMAEETNKSFGQVRPLIVVSEGSLTISGRLAFLQAADILLDTSINDGLNLNPFMFCCAHAGSGQRRRRASMIVSEFCGCSSFLTGAAKVNPWATQTVMNAMHAAVVMEEAESERRFKKDHSYVATQSLTEWAKENLSELKQALEYRDDAPVSGLGAGSQLFFMERGYRHLSQEAVMCDYRAAKTRAIFLDIEGTLAPERRSVLRPYNAGDQVTFHAQPLDPEVLDSIRHLTKDRSNTVTVISGREQGAVDNWFKEVDGIGLCAEHGCYWVLPSKLQLGTGGSRWQTMKASVDEDDDWKTIAFELVKQYAKRVQGSVAEMKGSAITWNYRKVGAQMLCKEIAQQLVRYLDPDSQDSLLHGYPITVAHGKGYVEVKRNDVNKGVAVNRVLQEIQNQIGPIDFVLCIGDDRSDEDMFQVVNSLAAEEEEIASACTSPLLRRHNPSESSISNITRMQQRGSITFEEFNPASTENRSKFYTVTVGRKPSAAAFFVKDVGEVSDLLRKLASQAINKLARFASMPVLAVKEDLDDLDLRQ